MTLLEAAKTMLEVLGDGFQDDGYDCVECPGTQQSGHTQGCSLGAAIKALREAVHEVQKPIAKTETVRYVATREQYDRLTDMVGRVNGSRHTMIQAMTADAFITARGDRRYNIDVDFKTSKEEWHFAYDSVDFSIFMEMPVVPKTKQIKIIDLPLDFVGGKIVSGSPNIIVTTRPDGMVVIEAKLAECL